MLRLLDVILQRYGQQNRDFGSRGRMTESFCQKLTFTSNTGDLFWIHCGALNSGSIGSIRRANTSERCSFCFEISGLFMSKVEDFFRRGSSSDEYHSSNRVQRNVAQLIRVV